MKNPEQIRVPRPLGTTEKGFHHSKHQSQESLQELQAHIIQHYINNNFLYCNRHYSIHELSIILKIPTKTIMAYTIKEGQSIRDNMDKVTSGESLRALLFMGIQSTLEDRSRALQQYSILSAAQGEGYKAFVSGEVNKALKLVMESGQNVLNIAKSLGGNGPTTNILINNGDKAQEGTKEGDGFITVDQVVMKLKDGGHVPLSLNEAEREKIYDAHDIENMPEVSALKQEGVDTSKEGLTMNRITDLPVDHQDRRAHEEGHNLDDDDIH
jgi:hypothetical protein